MVHCSLGSKNKILLLILILTALFMFTACTPKPPPETKIPEEKPLVEPPEIEEPEIKVEEEDIPVIEEPEEPPSEDISGEMKLSMAQESLRDITFDYNKYILTFSARSTLTENARFLNDNPEIKVSIEGHCDERGSSEYNLALGEKRAVSTKSFLESQGVPSNRLWTVSLGEEQPLDMGHNEVAWSKNRRVHFQVK